jgi:uncharacterized membrane protein YgcG
MSSLRRLAAAVAGIALATGIGLGLAAPAAAESIREFDVAVTIAPDTTFTVVETIRYDFEGEYRHGIYRDIPRYDETWSGSRWNYRIQVSSVTMDGAPVPVEYTEEGPFLRARIGDPFTTITGAHTYVITYTVAGGLRTISEEDAADPQMPEAVSAGDVELYWDLVGSGWDVPIADAAASVTGPGPVLSAACYTGPLGGDESCPAATARQVALLGGIPLGPGEPLTGAVVFPAESFTTSPQPDIAQGLPSSPAVGIAGALIPALLFVAVPVTLAISRRRADAGVPVPGAPPQYAPPDGLSPAELAAAWEGPTGAAKARVLVATLLDLAARRWIDVATDPSGDLEVTWRGTGSPALRPWEQSLLGVILKGAPTATMKGYDKDLALVWSATVPDLVRSAEASGRRNPAGDIPDRRWRGLGILSALLIVAGIAAAIAGQPFLSAIGFTTGIGALIGFIAATVITPRTQTQQSAVFLAKVEGLRTVLGTDAAASRREFAQRTGLTPAAIFATMLPFAVVFDLQDAWIGAFPDLTPDQLVSAGFGVASIHGMDGLVQSSTSSMSSAMTSPSSGSGGGGSSGGGGGGGGGGSW